ncbi:SulP family inorganic anion transporter [Rhabdothermincola salaria]|uniref:SulP family inorganic anion transporter n=1 Tax=Rhabdothermincola salaria TaxID=2903142 RepID=UPI001E36614F|nr:STAS domain-containing protein [Rhabdothermincola salaria]
MAASPLRRWLPGLTVAARYRRAWLRSDLLAGLVLTALLIPAGMGYAVAAGLPPETGLYATIVPLLAYAVFGPSRILVLGPDSSLAPLIAAAIVPLAAADADRAVALAGLLAIMMGGLLVLGGVLRLGFVTDLLSKPIRLGYLNGIALVVVVGQIPKLLGFSIDGDSFLGDLRELAQGVADGLVDPTAVGIGVACLVTILGLRLVDRRVPGVLVAVVGAIVAVVAFGWKDDVAVVGALPEGLPTPALSGITWSDVASLAGPALGIALIAFADTGVLSRTFAERRGEHVAGNDEMRGVGLANVAGGLLGGFPVSASSSRTPVADQAGAHTQLTGITGAVLIVAFILVAPGLTGYLPSAALAAVVIVAASALVDVRSVVRLLRVDPAEGLLSVAAFLGVAVIGVLEGIVVAVVLSFVAFVNQAWRPYRAELGRIPEVRGYHDLGRHPEGERLPGIVIVRFDAPLFFANGGMFGDYVRSVVADAGHEVETVILAAEPITDIDATAVDELVDLDDHLAARGITLILAEMKGPVKDHLRRYGLGDRFDPDRFAPTVGSAVDAILGAERDDIGNPSDRDDGS